MEELKDFKQFINGAQRNVVPIDKLIHIKKYLPIKEKIRFISEYKKIVEEHMKDYKDFEHIMAFVFFNLYVVKAYTNLDIKLTYEEFDVLQEHNLIDRIIDCIGSDYKLLMQFVNV